MIAASAGAARRSTSWPAAFSFTALPSDDERQAAPRAGAAVVADDPCMAAEEWVGGPPQANQYYRARYYDPKLGRFLSEDPLGMADGPNLYAYVASNPVLHTDPFGLQSMKMPPSRPSPPTSSPSPPPANCETQAWDKLRKCISDDVPDCQRRKAACDEKCTGTWKRLWNSDECRACDKLKCPENKCDCWQNFAEDLEKCGGYWKSKCGDRDIESPGGPPGG